MAKGDLSKKIDVDARGEILELKTTINTMVDTLSSFSSEVTRVAREVGSEGQLGGQARVEGVYGTWKKLTTNVNELALNLTNQVRAIAEVASAVTQGDMSGSISVEAQGEVAALKNNINLMVANLRETTRAKDWLESNLTRIAGLMQGHRDLVEVADLILRELTPLVNAQFGAFFLAEAGAEPGEGLKFIAGYGTGQADGQRSLPSPGTRGWGLITQAAMEKKRILVDAVPPDYLTISSGLGAAAPASVVILPVLFEDQVLGVIELASFSRFSEVHLAFIDQFANTIGVSINTIIANSRTESLLSESQRLTAELRQRSDELQLTNAELEEKAALLATSSQYKSEFLANMSHELRTPLNSLLVLSRLLADNPDSHLAPQEVEFAVTIHRAGSDLLQLINDILDLSKIEAGRMDVHPKALPLDKLLDYVRATFRPLTVDRGLSFDVKVGENVPRELYSDEQRLQQILRNLLSNAVKFTSTGGVELTVERVPAAGFSEDSLRNADAVIALAVKDTGIGIPAEKLDGIFEAFQQSDGTTNRKYGGTGLGLSISRDMAALLGGRIAAESEPGVGSTFTLYIPARYTGTSPSVPAASTGATPPTIRDNAPTLRDVPAAAEKLAERHAEAAGQGARTVAAAGAGGSEGRGDGSGGKSSGTVAAGAVGERGTDAHAAQPEAYDAGPADAIATHPGDVFAQPDGPTRTAAQAAPRPSDGLDVAWPETTRLREWLSGRPGRVLANRRILIVDDDIRNVFALTHVLGRVGISVKYAENGREGLEVLDKTPDVSLVLMDIMMPEMDGYEMIKAIRHAPRFADLPVIALTAKAMPGDREKAIESGADDYIPKPVDVDQLLAVICRLLDPQDHTGGARPASRGGADGGEPAGGGRDGDGQAGGAASDGGTARPEQAGGGQALDVHSGEAQTDGTTTGEAP